MTRIRYYKADEVKRILLAENSGSSESDNDSVTQNLLTVKVLRFLN